MSLLRACSAENERLVAELEAARRQAEEKEEELQTEREKEKAGKEQYIMLQLVLLAICCLL